MLRAKTVGDLPTKLSLPYIKDSLAYFCCKGGVHALDNFPYLIGGYVEYCLISTTALINRPGTFH